MEAVNLAVGLAVIMKLLAEGRQVVRDPNADMDRVPVPGYRICYFYKRRNQVYPSTQVPGAARGSVLI